MVCAELETVGADGRDRLLDAARGLGGSVKLDPFAEVNVTPEEDGSVIVDDCDSVAYQSPAIYPNLLIRLTSLFVIAPENALPSGEPLAILDVTLLLEGTP